MSEKKQHWEKVYTTKDDNEVSWYQERPEMSLRLISSVARPSDRIIDIGGGNSNLTSHLWENEFTNLSVLDISDAAIERSKRKAKDASQHINYVTSDVLKFAPSAPYAIWHDRATFHFLTEPEEVQQYVQRVQQSIVPGGYLIVGTFSTQGPFKCSGLDISQYSRESLNRVFSEYFTEVEALEEVHTTPFNTEQHFLFMVFRRK